jgi:alpha-tubulin suppressor-like RCC1 family protein
LGDGTTSNRFTPVNVIGLSGAASVSAGFESTCAITTSGGVKCWGSNQFGKLGDGTTTNRLTPVNVIGLSEIASIGKGNHHVCALSTTGVLKCWGYNSYGQLGSGITDVVEGCTTWGRFYDWMSESQCATYEGIWGDASVNYDSMTPTSVFNTGPQPGFPATVDVTVTDESGSATRSITLTLIR